MGFATRLREASWAAHGSAEAEGALSALMRYDDADRDGFLALHVALLTQLHFVYDALEHNAATMRTDPVAAPFADPALTRLPALRADLAHLGHPFRDARPLPATERYVERLMTSGRAGAGQFVAHHYTRYLGDLSGGLAVGAKVRQVLGLEHEDGHRFFRFDAIAPGPFKRAYRQLLDDAPWDETQQQRVIDEVLVAYALNNAMQSAVLASTRAAA